MKKTSKNTQKSTPSTPQSGGNSAVNDINELWAGQNIELLKALHILTSDGKLNADSRRKLKQVKHLVQFINPILENIYDQDIQNQNTEPRIVDLGAGKSYLGLILYDLILSQHPTGTLYAVEARDELVKRSQTIAASCSFDRIKFITSTIANAKIPSPVDLVCALHACDTATDDAIDFGIRHQARHFVLVPCCQASLARRLEKNLNDIAPEWQALIRFPLHRREAGSHLTNVMRVLRLESLGYQVTVTELVGWEHSMKNELILATQTGKPNARSIAQLDQLQAALKLQ